MVLNVVLLLWESANTGKVSAYLLIVVDALEVNRRGRGIGATSKMLISSKVGSGDSE